MRKSKNQINKEIIESHGFTVKKQKDGWDVHCYTPAGEDWWMFFRKLSKIKEYGYSYDPEEDFETLYEAGRHGFKGVPPPGELWKDQLWKQTILRQIATEIEE